MVIDSAELRRRFSRVLERDEIYLANHSLGRILDQTERDLQEGLALWYEHMDDSWTPWLEELNRWRGNTARLLGYSREDCVVPKTSAGQGLRAVLNSFPTEKPIKIVSTTGEFDSVDFVLKTYESLRRAHVEWVKPREGSVPLFYGEDIAAAIQRRKPDLVVVSLVFFTTGQILQDVAGIVAAAHEVGAAVVLDVYHAAGVIPLSLDTVGVDFAIGGSYKYLRGGPGACWLAIHPNRLPNQPGRPPTLDTGWFAKRDTFDYRRSSAPEVKAGGDGWLESTLPVLMPYQARAGLALVHELGVAAIRNDSLERQGRLREALRARGIVVFEPTDPEEFGAYSLIPHSHAAEFCRSLKKLGVNVDSRGDFIRLCPDFLTTEDEIARAAEIIANAR